MGFLVLPELLEPELCHILRERLTRLKDKYDPEPWREDPEVEGKRYTFKNIVQEDDVFLQLAIYEPILSIVDQLIGRDATLHFSHGMIRPITTRPTTGWHRDGPPLQARYAQLAQPVPLVTLRFGVFLTDLSEPNMGNLVVVPGSHKAIREPDLEGTDQVEDLPGSVPVLLREGSAVIFHNALWHAVMANRSPFDRLAVYLGYGFPWMRFWDGDLSAPGIQDRVPAKFRHLLGGFEKPSDAYSGRLAPSRLA